MARHELFLLVFLTSSSNSLNDNRHRIMTPNNVQTGNPPTQGNNNNDAAMFPHISSSSLPAGSKEGTTAPSFITSATPTKGTIPTGITQSVPLPTTATETVTPGRGTIIKVEFPSSINIFVNVTNCCHSANDTVNVSGISTVEVPTVDGTIGTSTVSTTALEMDTSRDVANDISTLESTTETQLDADSTMILTTLGTSTITMDILENSTESLTPDGTVITTITNSTNISPTTTDSSETLTTESVVEAIDNATNVENSSLSASDIKLAPPETVTNVQINVDLSDKTQNANFGSTTRPTSPRQNEMIYQQKCDEYYSNSRTGREIKVQVFIVGGTSSLPKEFPHMVALGYGNEPKKEWLCGGSLISENYVITAAHCLSSSTLGVVQMVRLGTTVLTETLNSEDRKVVRRIPHPDYDTREQYNDIALLQLDRPVTFSEYISPICLYPARVTDEVLIATGWGKNESSGDVSRELQKVELEYFPNKDCQDSYSVVSKQDLPKGIEAETQICAGSRSEQKDTCQGDSGGPLQIKKDEKFYLIGLTSFGIACGTPGRPGVYTRVSHYIPWIENIVWSNGR